jgi:hypothetical protein
MLTILRRRHRRVGTYCCRLPIGERRIDSKVGREGIAVSRADITNSLRKPRVKRTSCKRCHDGELREIRGRRPGLMKLTICHLICGISLRAPAAHTSENRMRFKEYRQKEIIILTDNQLHVRQTQILGFVALKLLMQSTGRRLGDSHVRYLYGLSVNG